MDGSIPPEQTRQNIVPRKGPDFGLDGDIERHWFGGDVFKTRFFDAMSLLFPDGERFFIQCVRDYKDQIRDPELLAQVKEFTYQEGQHGMVHTTYNERVARQGVAVDKVTNLLRGVLDWERRNLSASWTLSFTAAAEHMTAIMAHSFMKHPEVFEKADPRIRALYVWHGVEEIEHKAVAYDVMKKVAKVGYLQRVLGMMYLSIVFPLHTFMIMNHMFKVDAVPNRLGTWLRGLWWLYGVGGVMTRLVPHYLAYYLPGYHPWKAGQMDSYERWRGTFERTGGDAIAAAEALRTA